jgi:hypothetical protein
MIFIKYTLPGEEKSLQVRTGLIGSITLQDSWVLLEMPESSDIFIRFLVDIPHNQGEGMNSVNHKIRCLWFISLFAMTISFPIIPVVSADSFYGEDTRAGCMTNEAWIYNWYLSHPDSLLYSTDMAYQPFKMMAFPQDITQPGSGNGSISSWRPVLPPQDMGSPFNAPLTQSLDQPFPNRGLNNGFLQPPPYPLDIVNGIYSNHPSPYW